MNDILNDYRLMRISRSTLCENLGTDIYNATVEHPLCVRAVTELFYFLDKETDPIISVLAILETLDEEDACISDEELRAMQHALCENTEYTLNAEK